MGDAEMKGAKAMKHGNEKMKIRDGWHVVNGWDVYVADGFAVRGLSRDGQRPLYLYTPARGGGLDRVDGVPFGALRGRMNHGAIVLR